MVLLGQYGSYQVIDEPVSQGKFGKVQMGNRLSDGLPVVIKRIPAYKQSSSTDLINKLLLINNPNLAKTIDFVNVDDVIWLVRVYYEGENLKVILKKNQYRRKESQRYFIELFCTVLTAIDALHKESIVHLDIKPSNIIVLKKNEVLSSSPDDVVLIDFEQASLYPIINQRRSPFSMIYSPPEQLLNYNHLCCPQSDLFAISSTLFEALSGYPSFIECNAEVLLNLQLTYPLKKPSRIDEDMFAILAKGAFKQPFPLPPRRLSSDSISEVLKEGIKGRYASANSMKAELLMYLQNHPVTEKSSWVNNFFKW